MVGTNFGAQAVILWNGKAVVTTQLDASTVAATLDSTVLASPTTVQLQVRNTADGTQSQAVPLTVAPAVVATTVVPALNISTSALPAGTVGAAYALTLQASGGTPAYSWSLGAGTLPAGLSLAQNGLLSGTPLVTGIFNVTFTVTDVGSPVQSKSLSTSIVVSPSSPLSFATSTLASAVKGNAYAQMLPASGGTAPYTWTIAAGSLPAGLGLSATSGILSGTPTVAGAFSFTVAVSDSTNPMQTRTTSFSLVVAAPTLSLLTTSLAPVTVGNPYAQTLQATGGTAPYSWLLSSGNLPTGLSLNTATGLISGTPTTIGTSSFAVTLADAGSPVQTRTVDLSITVASTILNIYTAALADGTRGSSYGQSLQATGGVAPYTWSVVSGSLPAGITLNPSTGLISGTPSVSGTSSLVISVADSSASVQSKTASFSITVSAPTLVLNTSALAAGTNGSAYTQGLQASGGTAPYIWSVASGSLPAGLTLNASTGLISGTPTASGTFSFVASVADSSAPSQTRTANLSLVVSAPVLVLNTASLAGGTNGTAYTQTLQASGGTAPYTWSVVSGSLPVGLALNPSTGALSGTPSVTGNSSFVVSLTDSSNPVQIRSANLALAVAPSALVISTSTLTAGTSGTAYTQSLQATGGTAPYSWSLASGTLPAGLTLSSTGVVSGTPTVAGTKSFSVVITDASSPAQTRNANLSLVIASSTLAISTSSLPAGTSGTTYSQSLQATGGTTPYSWSVSAGSLPAGLSLSAAGVLSGTPSAVGTASFTASLSDASSPVQTRSVTLSLAVAPPTLSITTSTLAAGSVSTVYTQALQATGGTAPYTWTVSAGSLPAGLSLASTTGVISGTPTTYGTSNVTISITDSGSPTQSKSVSLALVIAPSTLTITSSTLSAGVSGSSYSKSVSASGGTTPYTWSVTAGSLPAGLTLAASTGVISGTPTAAGTSSFTLTVKDGGSPAQTKSVATSLTIAPGALRITTATLTTGTAGTAYAQLLSATGGTPSYTWNYSGNLPSGLTLAATTGIISGTPTTSGTFTFTVSVTDNSTPSQLQTLATSITVNPATVSGPGTTWYIRNDGGTRYSSRSTSGQCDGKADAAYGGVGTNQHCAFGDYRYLWDDQSYGGYANWAISGGDTVIVRGGPWRVGFNQGTNPNDAWCIGGNGPFSCGNPTIPAGSPTQHTRILGENYASCSATNKTEVFGGFGVGVALNLGDAQYVDVQCLNITRHSQCMVHGSPAVPSTCSKSYPLDDYDSDGITTSSNTHDVLLQDLWIHGHTDRGIIGPIGANITCLRCDIAFNGMAGWDFDNGSGPASVFGTNASLKLLYSTIEWSGCNQQYPAVDTIPVISCYSQSTGGYGDGIGTPAGTGTGMSVTVDHTTFRYNTQDGLDLGHMDAGNNTLSITNSKAYANNGQGFKWGAYFQTAVFTDNLLVANCLRMSQPIPGAPTTYNTYVSDFCRAQDALSFNFVQGGTALLANNTIVTYAPTTYDMNCWSASCSTSTLTFQNNITLGYSNPTTYTMGGQVGGPGGFYFQAPIGNIVRNNNIYSGIRSVNCPTGNAAEYCTSPLLVNQPTWVDETSLDNFNFNLTAGSPAKAAGVLLPSVTTDYNGLLRANPPSIGAIE